MSAPHPIAQGPQAMAHVTGVAHAGTHLPKHTAQVVATPNVTAVKSRLHLRIHCGRSMSPDGSVARAGLTPAYPNQFPPSLTGSSVTNRPTAGS